MEAEYVPHIFLFGYCLFLLMLIKIAEFVVSKLEGNKAEYVYRPPKSKKEIADHDPLEPAYVADPNNPGYDITGVPYKIPGI